MNEDVFPMEKGDFPMSKLVFRGAVVLWSRVTLVGGSFGRS